jgi:hypothetical protein
MAITTRKPFVYTQECRYHGEPPSSAAGSSTAPALVNSGVHKLVLASTYVLQRPDVGSLVTIYSVGVDASVISKTSTGGSVSFNGAGGTTQALNLLYDSTVLNDPCVTLMGESATQWRIIGFGANGAMATSNAGISVTT